MLVKPPKTVFYFKKVEKSILEHFVKTGELSQVAANDVYGFAKARIRSTKVQLNHK